MTHIDYTAKDFLSIRQRLVETAQDRLPEWTPTGTADFALAIIESVAYMGDILSYYTDRTLNESFLSTAAQRSSVIDIARMLGYEPQGPVPATVTLTFTVDASAGDVTIPAGTRVSTSVAGSDRNVVFETDADETVLQGGGPTVTVTATEGQTVSNEVLGVATTAALQRFDLAQRPVVSSSIQIEVDEGNGFEPWVYFEHLLDADANTPAFTFTRADDGTVQIRFGDDIDGRIPAQNSTIRATYRVGGGSRGNVATKTITTLVDAVQGVSNVQNLVAASGGEDPESIDDIRRNAPIATRTGDRAVTLRDFKDLASVVPGVAHASAEADTATHVFVYVAPSGIDQPALNAVLQQKVEDELSERAMLGTSATVQGPTYVPIDVALTVYVNDSFSQSAVSTNVERAVEDLYALSNVDFGKTLPVSDLYRTVSAVEGVDYLNVTTHDRDAGTGVVNQIQHTVSELPYLNDATIAAVGGITG